MNPLAKSGKDVSIRMWRIVIAFIFFLSLLLQLGLAILIQQRGQLNPGDFTSLVVKLLTLYAAPFGIIFGGIFIAQAATQRLPSSTAIVVLCLAIVWNALLIIRYFMLFYSSGTDDIGQLANFQDKVIPVGGFLTAAAMTYLYGKN